MARKTIGKILSGLVLPVIFLALRGPEPAAAGYASIVVEADSGRVLHAVNPDTPNPPASLTKMMTLYLVFEALERGRLSMNKRLRVSRRAAGMAPSKLGLRRGSTITVRDAILALVTKSANDAAVVLAEALGGSEVAFARMMTLRARELGMRRTNFRNASGLPARRQYSTARDMSILARRLIADFPQYYGFFSTREFRFGKRVFRNHNRLLHTYAGVDGIKTGYTRASGYNLVTSVRRWGRRVIGVVFGARSAAGRDQHMRYLLEKAFRQVPRAQRTYPRPALRALRTASALAGTKKTLPKAAKELFRTDRSRNWAIQVGAFSAPGAARLAAYSAAGRIPALTRGASAAVVVHRSAGLRVYRAQLVGFSERGARDSCRMLKALQVDCVVVPPGG